MLALVKSGFQVVFYTKTQSNGDRYQFECKCLTK